MKKIQLAAVAFILVGFTSLQAQWGTKNISGNGQVITKTIQTSDYDGLSVGGNFYVTIVEGHTGTITLKGESNLLEEVIVEVEGNSLQIKTDNKVNLKPSRGMKIEVTVPASQLSRISLAGSGEIKNGFNLKSDQLSVRLAGSGSIKLNLQTTELDTSVAGSGNMFLNGLAAQLKGSISGSGTVDAYRLKAENASISIAGSGHYNVNCSGELKARVSGSGNINYKGKPDKVDSRVAGSGKILSAN
jgi:hypothetical protein